MTVQTETLAEYILVEHRWLIVVTLLLPMSAIWKVYSFIRNYVVFMLKSAPKKHEKKVKEVQRQVKQWLAGDRSTKLCTARPSWQTMSFRHGLYKKTSTNIKVDLVDVLEVDTKNMTVRCEPLVTMGHLTRILRSYGFTLPMTPELDQLTVGGMVMGTGVESSSHVHGLFQHICLEYELVMADGSVVTCSKDETPDLFYSVSWSYGTLGFLTSVLIKVIPAKKYVRLEYHPYANSKDLCKRFRDEAKRSKPHFFLEGVMYTKETGVIMVGDMVDEIENDGKYNPIGAWYAEWFYKQVEKHLNKMETVVEYIPLRDYYHRHTKSLFWELQDIVSFGNIWLFRVLFGWLMPPEVSLLKLTQPQAVTDLYNRAHVIEDMMLQVDHLEDALELVHKEFLVFPLWLCPFKLFNNPGLLRVKEGQDMYFDLGIYGVPKAKGFEIVKSTRAMEKFLMDIGAFQMLCGDTYTTPEEFRRMFDHTLYDKVRNSLPNCKEAFPDVYYKVCRKSKR